ncbi:hypothetical protein D5086_013380 [Populus alba]|uniref:Uncharacterized protein n=2 Tax=Populus alba TaxID=43335 RepID=A0ACC4C5H5_POPAL|nr:hypothetical protein D5086_0000300150 [Populus alba]
METTIGFFLNSRCGNDQISPATAQDSKVEFCHMYTCSNQKMMRYKRLESARPGSWGHLFDKIEEAEDICSQLQPRDDAKICLVSIQSMSSRWYEDDMLTPDSNVDENEIFKKENELLEMGNEILERIKP